MGFIDSVDTMILGANTYDQTKDYWPNAADQGEYGEKLNNLTKFVASATLEDAPWGRLSRRDRDPRPRRHHPRAQGAERQGPVAVGEPEAHALPDGRRVVDEVRMLVCPAVTRQGNASCSRTAET